MYLGIGQTVPPHFRLDLGREPGVVVVVGVVSTKLFDEVTQLDAAEVMVAALDHPAKWTGIHSRTGARLTGDGLKDKVLCRAVVRVLQPITRQPGPFLASRNVRVRVSPAVLQAHRAELAGAVPARHGETAREVQERSGAPWALQRQEVVLPRTSS